MEIANKEKTLTKKSDFIELLYSGYSQGNIFDSNIPEDLKKLNPKETPKKLIIAIGEGMVVPGLDKDLEDKEIEKDYEIKLKAKDAFGERDRNLLKTIPLKVFHEKDMEPRPGTIFAFDNSIAKVVTVSGARVITDFNNPLAGKEVLYKYKITRIVTDDKEKCTALFEGLFRFVPEFDINDKEITIKGPKQMEIIISAFKDKVIKLLSKELKFELKEEKKVDVKTEEKDKKENKEEKKDI